MVDAQLAAGRTEQALASLRRGTQIDPDHQRYWSQLGELLMRLERYGEAEDALAETLRRWPCDLPSRTNLANVYSRTASAQSRSRCSSRASRRATRRPSS